MFNQNFLVFLGFFQDLIKYKNIYVYPIIVGVIIGCLAPLIGSVIVIRRLSFIADTLSHFSLAGVCFGVLLAHQLADTVFENTISPIALGIVFSVIGTLLIEKLRSFYKNYKELSMPIVMSFGAALSGIFIALSGDSSSNITSSLLFGSISIVELKDFIVILVMSLIIIIFIVIFYKKIITLCFDETFAKVSGINVKLLQLLITIILAVFISISMEIVGVLLISSLMIVPVASSILVGKSFKNTCIISVIFSEVSILLGIYFSYTLSVPTGSLIVIFNIVILLFIMIYRNLIKCFKKKNTKQLDYSITIDPNTINENVDEVTEINEEDKEIVKEENLENKE